MPQISKKKDILPEDLTNTTTIIEEISNLIEYDEEGNVLPGSVKLFPERSGEAAYMFTKIPTHLADGTQIADSPEYAKNWGASYPGLDVEVPILKIHFDEIREVLNRNHFKWTLHNGTWSSRGENNYKIGSQSGISGLTFSEIYNIALSAYYNSSSSQASSTPKATNDGYYNFDQSYGSAQIVRSYSYLTLNDMMPAFCRTVDFYIMGETPTSSLTTLFHANGDPILEGVWNRFDQHIDSSAEEEYAEFGSLDVPVSGNENTMKGYITKDYAIICKWDLPTINISEPSPPYADVSDTDRDGKYDAGVNFDDREFATGNFVHLPDKDSPQLFIPISRYVYFDRNDKSSWVYIGQGEKKKKYLSSIIRAVGWNEPLDRIISPLDNQDRDTYLYMHSEANVSKDFFVDIWWNDSVRNIHIKRLGIIRPNQQVVIFDFPWDAATQKFSEVGYPTGIHKNRTYRLYLTEYESNYASTAYLAKLHFGNSDIMHIYSAFGEGSNNIYNFEVENWNISEGRSVVVVDNKKHGDMSYYYYDFLKNNEIKRIKYDLNWEWDENYRLSKVYYIPKGSKTGKEDEDTIKVELGYGAEGKVIKLTKTVPASMAINGQTTYEISVNGNTITYPGGRTSAMAVDTSGGNRVATITETDPDSGTAVKEYEYGANEQLLKYTVTANNNSAVTSYTYYDGDGKYPNGSRVDQKLKSVTYPDGSWEYYTYNSNGYIEKIYSPSTGNSTPEETENYTQYGYDKHESISYSGPQTSSYSSWCFFSYYDSRNKVNEWIFDKLLLHKKPSTIIGFYNEREVSRKLHSNIPDEYIMEKVCSAKNAGWDNSNNLQLKAECLAGEITDTSVIPGLYWYLIKEETSPLNEVSYSYATEGPVYEMYISEYSSKLRTIATVKDADGVAYRKIETVTNPWGIVESRVVTDLLSGKVISSAVSEVDSFGRITKTTYLDGTTEEFKDYCQWGPQKLIDRDGDTTDYVYTADGLIKEINAPGQKTELSYDALGNVTQRKVTANGKTITETSTYDAQSRITSHTDGAGITRTYVYTGPDVAMTTSDGKTMNTDYNLDGTVASVTGNSVSPVFYEYGSDNLGTWKKTIHGENAQAGIWEKEYFNMLGKLRRTETSSGYSKDYVYDSKGRLASSSDSNGNQMSLTYNGRSEITSRTVNDATTNYTYGYNTRDDKTTYKTTATTPSAFGNIVSEKETSLDGLDSWSKLNGREDHTQVTRHGGGRYTVKTTDFENVVTKTSNETKINNFTMNRATTLTESTPNLTMERETDGFGMTVSTEARGLTTKYEYRDGSEQLEKVTEPDGKLTTMEYIPGKHEPVLAVLSGGDTLIPAFNKFGQLEKLTGTAPENFDVTKTFDVFGREINLETNGVLSNINTVRTYDSVTGALLAKTIAGHDVYNITYHNDGRINTITRAVGSGSAVTKTFQYTAAPKYLFAGIDYSDSTPDVTVSGHDAVFGLPGSVSTSGLISYAFGYNNDLQITSANVTSGTSGNKNVSYTYDNLRRQGMNFGGTAVSYEYDENTKRLKKVICGNVEAEYAYVPNSINKILSVTIKKGGNTVSTRTIALESGSDRIASVTNTNGASAVLNSFVYQYNDKKQINKITREEGSYKILVYEPRGQLSSVQRYTGGKVRVGDWYKYEYDSITNVLKGGRIDTDGNFEFTATPTVFNNVQARLTGGKITVNGEAAENAKIALYVNGDPSTGTKASRNGKEFFATLDAGNSSSANGMKLSIAASYFDPNATPELGGDQGGNVPGADILNEIIGTLVIPKQNESPVYDNGGRLLSNSIYTCTWDGEDRLTDVESMIKLDGVNRYWLEYDYDHAGRRIRKRVNTNNDSGWVLARTHKYFYDTVTLGGKNSDFGLLTEEQVTDHSTATTKTYQYLWGLDLDGSYHGLGGIGGLIAVINTTDNKVYVPQMDAKGTVYKYIDADTGAVAAEFDYDPYGRVMRSSGTQVANLNLRYQTKYLDTETNTYYYGIRHYDPSLCRWMTRDPLEEKGGYNLYAFVNNDPINNFDYLGCEKSSLWADIKTTFSSPLNYLKVWLAYNSGGAGALWGGTKAFGRGVGQAGANAVDMYSMQQEIKDRILAAAVDKVTGVHISVSGSSNIVDIGKSLENNTFRAGEYYLNTSLNIVSFGVYGQGKSTYDYIMGNISEEQWSETQISTGIAQLMPAAVKYGPRIVRAVGSKKTYNPTPTTPIPESSPTGEFYSVAYQMKLSPKSYPGLSRYMHFKEANIALESTMEYIPRLTKLGIKIPKSPSGVVLGKSPSGWVWHHDVNTGVMQLVPKGQHPSIPGGIFWETMHPNLKGGYSIWGK